MIFSVEIQMNEFGEDSDWFESSEIFSDIVNARKHAKDWKEGVYTSRSPHAVRIVDYVKKRVVETF